MTESDAFAPLDGVRVLDLSRYLPGGVLTRKLADLGADVVKVERPGIGDPLRATPPFVDGESVFHRLVNHGKRSIELGLGAADVEVLRALAARADVVVEVSTGVPGALAAALPFAELARSRPDVVLCSVSGFGMTGPLAGVPSHGMTLAALAGSLALAEGSVEAGRPEPTALGQIAPIAIDLPASNGALAVVAALLQARTTGRGAWIDLSCWDVIVEAHRSGVLRSHLEGGAAPDAVPLGSLYAMYLARDGQPIQFAAVERNHWNAFCDAIGRPELRSRFAAGTDYDYGDESLHDDLVAIFRERTATEWASLFATHRLPAAPVLDVAGVARSEHLKARGLVADGVIANPIRLAATGVRPGAGAAGAPGLGVDTAEVLENWLGQPASAAKP